MPDTDLDDYRKFQARQDQLATRKNRIMLSFFLILVVSGWLASDHFGAGASTAAFFLAAISYMLGYFYSDTDSTMREDHRKYTQSSQD